MPSIDLITIHDRLLQDALQAIASPSLDEVVEEGLRSLVRFSR